MKVLAKSDCVVPTADLSFENLASRQYFGNYSRDPFDGAGSWVEESRMVRHHVYSLNHAKINTLRPLHVPCEPSSTHSCPSCLLLRKEERFRYP